MNEGGDVLEYMLIVEVDGETRIGNSVDRKWCFGEGKNERESGEGVSKEPGGNGGHYVLKSGNKDSNIINLFECLPVAETLSIPLDNYYYIIRIDNGNFDVDYVFREAGLLLEDDICSFTLKDYADIWLEHLNELQIRSFKN
nr:hypothetical protein [Tanacetum cinerariifolium]